MAARKDKGNVASALLELLAHKENLEISFAAQSNFGFVPTLKARSGWEDLGMA